MESKSVYVIYRHFDNGISYMLGYAHDKASALILVRAYKFVNAGGNIRYRKQRSLS